MGTTYVDLTLRNGFAGKDVRVRALVDTGAIHTTVTRDVAERLGFDLEEVSVYRLTVADGRRVRAPRIAPLEIRLDDRYYIGEAAVLGDECLMGLLALEAMDLIVDPIRRRVIPDPAHPDGPEFRA